MRSRVIQINPGLWALISNPMTWPPRPGDSDGRSSFASSCRSFQLPLRRTLATRSPSPCGGWPMVRKKSIASISRALSELREVSSPNAGWFGQHTRGGNPRYIESMVSAIADTIAYHVEQTCGVAIKEFELSSEAKEIIDEKKAEYLKNYTSDIEPTEITDEDAGMPNALDCPKCKVRNAVIKLDGCLTCVSCADSKCG